MTPGTHPASENLTDVDNLDDPSSPLAFDPDGATYVRSVTLIDQFCDTIWLEDGLSRNTLDAYRRDLRLYNWRTRPRTAHLSRGCCATF